MLQVVAESIKKTGFFYEKEYYMSVVVSEKNAALSAADTQMEVLRKIAERFLQNTVSAGLTARENVLKDHDPLAESQRTVKDLRNLFHQSGAGKVDQPGQGEIKQKLIF